MTASESIAGSPRARSMVSTVTIPAPVKRGVRRTSSQATIARVRLRPVRRLRRVAEGTQPARRARSGFFLAAAATTPGPSNTIGPGSTSIARGTEAMTTRTVRLVRRELMCWPSTLRVRITRIAPGLATSTSVSTVSPPSEEIVRMRRPCSRISPPAPRMDTELRGRGVGLRASVARSTPSVSV